MTESQAHYSTSVLQFQDPNTPIEPEPIIHQWECDALWKESSYLADRYENTGNESYRLQMIAAGEKASQLQRRYYDQRNRKLYTPTSYTIVPKYNQAKINGQWYAVEVLQIINNTAAQVRALPVDGYQPKPFGMVIDHPGMPGFKLNADTGSIALFNLRSLGV